MSFLRPKFPRLFLLTLILSVVLVLLELVLRVPRAARPGDLAGLVLGIGSTVLMVGAAALALRKRYKRYSWLGRTQLWLQFHVYGGWLGVLAALLHSGMDWPHGTLNWLLWLLTLWVGISGLFGVVLQKWIPTLLASGLRLEVVFERIEEHVAGLLSEADAIAQSASMQVRNFYSKELRPSLTSVRPSWTYALDITGGFSRRVLVFEHVAGLTSGEERERVEDLRIILQEKNELDAHYSLQKMLRAWLVWHVAPSWALLMLILAHIYVVVVY